MWNLRVTVCKAIHVYENQSKSYIMKGMDTSLQKKKTSLTFKILYGLFFSVSPWIHLKINTQKKAHNVIDHFLIVVTNILTPDT